MNLPLLAVDLNLNAIWFVLVFLLLAGYVVLDGFDLGVGMLHLLARGDRERRILLNSIGPLWDGNEVWLVTAGGALFAAFPEVYATAFSGFYLTFMLLLFGLIFRAVAIEFRSKRGSPAWRWFWDVSFSLASFLISLLIGVALGNIAWGVPLTARHELPIGPLDLLRPYPLLVGVMGVALFLTHGAIYIVLKTDGDLYERARAWSRNAAIFFILCYAVVTAATLLYAPWMTARFWEHPVLFVVPALTLLAIANIPREIHRGRDFRAFLSSGLAMMGLLALFAIGLYPNLIYSDPNPAHSLTIYNGSSTDTTLRIMLIFAAIGMPLVVAYTFSVQWVFRGKVRLDETSY